MGRSNGAIMCLNTGIVYASAAKAAECLHILESGISRCLRGERLTYKGLSFAFCDAALPLSELEKFRIDSLRNLFLLYGIEKCSVEIEGDFDFFD